MVAVTKGGGTALPMAWKASLMLAGNGWSAAKPCSAASSLGASHLAPDGARSLTAKKPWSCG
eukprot:15473300-Alexandrium_andersonii.AAC.1